MSSKNWTVSLLSVTLFIIVLFGMVQFYLDPLLQYGNERGPLTFRTYSEIYSNPGIAKNYDYVVVNDALEDCIEDVKTIIKAEKLKAKRFHFE